ncbi:MAG: hypothetical protein R2724_04130 [Bryobacterales bacterium]
MINLASIGYVLGQFLVIFALTMAVPLFYGFAAGDDRSAPCCGHCSRRWEAAALVVGLKKPVKELTNARACCW